MSGAIVRTIISTILSIGNIGILNNALKAGTSNTTNIKVAESKIAPIKILFANILVKY